MKDGQIVLPRTKYVERPKLWYNGGPWGTIGWSLMFSDESISDTLINIVPATRLHSPGTCFFCGHKLDRPVNYSSEYSREFGIILMQDITVYACSYCGWWILVDDLLDHAEGECFGESQLFESLVHRFDDEPIEEPVALLRREINKGAIDLQTISPRQFELLIGSIFKDFFDCQVQHVGGPGDGGVDILLVAGKAVSLVQVKRRTSARRKESVSVIRELLGTMIIEGSNRGIIATSGSGVTRAAQKVIKIARERCHLDISVYDQQRIREALQIVENNEATWEGLFQRVKKPVSL